MLVSSVMYKYDEAIQDSGIMEMVQLEQISVLVRLRPAVFLGLICKSDGSIKN